MPRICGRHFDRRRSSCLPQTDRDGWRRSEADATEWFDSHCHVHDERIPDGADGAVEAARDAGVHTMVTVGCDRATSLAAIEVAARFDDVYATVGLHPHDASNGVDSIVDLLDTPGVVAVGEAGLDYYYDHSPRDAQQTAFAAQIQLAHERQLPLIIHTRDAWDDTFDILRAEGTPERTIFHCFTGGPDEARRCLDLGATLSFSGIVTFKGAPEVQAAARLCPLDRMLSRPTARTSHRCRTAANRTVRPGCLTSAGSSPISATSTPPRSPTPRRRTRRCSSACDRRGASGHDGPGRTRDTLSTLILRGPGPVVRVPAESSKQRGTQRHRPTPLPAGDRD